MVFDIIDLISSSVGTINQFAFQPIREVIKLALDKGIIIVAAMDNGNRYSMPACLQGVVGVRASTDYIDGNYAFRWHPFDGIEIVASGKQILRSNRGSIHITSCKNSFAAPVITAYIADIIQKYGTKSHNEILAYLSKKASHVVGEYISDKCLYYWDSVYKEDIYNWDKEAYSKAVKEYIKYKNIDITSPLISVSGDNYAKTRELIIDLVSFAAKYYTYIVVSSDFVDVDRNIILPDLCDGQIFINNLFDLYRPDLLIANIPYSINSDLEIEINESIVLSYQVGDDYASETYGFADSQIIERVFSILS